jgi:ribosomal protein S18 acetylase RimI-like enzyme
MGAIRLAAAADAKGVIACVDAAFQPYVAAIGKPPAPMLADYPQLIANGQVYILEEEGLVAGVLVLEPQAEGLLVETLAVDPARQRSGVGRRLMAFAESEAVRLHLPRIHLYTHETMRAARAFYAGLGYRESGQRVEDGYARVFFERQVAAPAAEGNGAGRG